MLWYWYGILFLEIINKRLVVSEVVGTININQNSISVNVVEWAKMGKNWGNDMNESGSVSISRLRSSIQNIVVPRKRLNGAKDDLVLLQAI